MTENIAKVFRLAEDSTKRFAPQKLGWSWGQALFLYGLALIDQENGTGKYTDYLKSYYDYYIAKGHRVNTSDTAAPGLGAYTLAKLTGEEKYYQEAMRVRQYIASSPKVVEDMPNHLGNGIESWFYPKSIWIDSIMMYGVFCSLFAKGEQDAQLMEFAQAQPALFEKYLRDKKTGLYYHCYWTKKGTHYPKTPIFWGRGNGWVTAAISLFADNFSSLQAKEDALRIHKELSIALAPWQREDGYFETIFNKVGKTYKESSATMLIAAGWFYGYRKGFLPKEYLERAKLAFDAVVSDFQVKKGLLSMPYISAPTTPLQVAPYFFYKILPCGNDLKYGLFAAFIAALEYKRCLETV